MHITLQTRMLLAKAEALRQVHHALREEMLLKRQHLRNVRFEMLCRGTPQNFHGRNRTRVQGPAGRMEP
jgi:hypothetical protein